MLFHSVQLFQAMINIHFPEVFSYDFYKKYSWNVKITAGFEPSQNLTSLGHAFQKFPAYEPVKVLGNEFVITFYSWTGCVWM